MMFHINLGPCSACETNGAVLEACRVCSGCLADLDRLCLACADQACPACGGKLGRRNDVFPYSLFSAIERGDLDAVNYLHHAHGKDINAQRDRSGRSPLSFAASSSSVPRKHRLELVRCLLDLGAIPMQGDLGGRTPLMHAAMNRTLTQSLAELLAGAVNCQDSVGKTALMYAAEGHNAVNARAGDRNTARFLLESGADTLVQCRRGRTALGYAVHANDNGTNEAMVHYLKQEMLRQAAEHIFRSEYKATFDADGGLVVRHKSGAIVPLA